MTDVEAHVVALYRYPVKSMRGEAVEAASIDLRGLAGDREWAVTFADGRVGSGKTWQHVRRLSGLLNFSATTVGGNVEVRTPEEEVLPVGSVRLKALLTELAGEPVSMARETRSSHFDVAGVHLISHSSLATLAAQVPDGVHVTVERFRPNIVLDGPAGPCPEERWVGQTILIGGELELEIIERTERCVMTTLPQADLPDAKPVLKTLATEFAMCIGVYARVLRGGWVKRGDAVRLC